jgi:hypothetical protein
MVIIPREFGQVLNDAIVGLGGVWRVLVWPALLVSVPVSIATVVAFSTTGGAEFIDLALNSPESLQALPEEVFWEVVRPFYIAIAIASFLQLVAGIFLALISHRAVASHLRGQSTSSREATRHALKRYPTGLWATVIVVLFVGALIAIGAVVWLMPLRSVGVPNPASALVALVLLVVVLGPGIWAGVSVSMTTAAITLERRGAVDSIRRSIQLVRGRWWATAGFLLLVGLLGGIAVQLIQLIALPLAVVGGGGATLTIASGLGALAQGVLIAAITAMYTHWYVDLRARTETLSTESLG